MDTCVKQNKVLLPTSEVERLLVGKIDFSYMHVDNGSLHM